MHIAQFNRILFKAHNCTPKPIIKAVAGTPPKIQRLSRCKCKLVGVRQFQPKGKHRLPLLLTLPSLIFIMLLLNPEPLRFRAHDAHVFPGTEKASGLDCHGQARSLKDGMLHCRLHIYIYIYTCKCICISSSLYTHIYIYIYAQTYIEQTNQLPLLAVLLRS